MLKVRFNEKSWSAKVKNIENRVEQEVKDNLVNIAEILADATVRFTDTGAYAESFSVVPASFGGGRSRTSQGRPRRQDAVQYRNIALQNMTADIAGLQLLENRSVSFRNRAPHANYVEGKYHVFGVAKDVSR